jgi:hypothetical protein
MGTGASGECIKVYLVLIYNGKRDKEWLKKRLDILRGVSSVGKLFVSKVVWLDFVICKP